MYVYLKYRTSEACRREYLIATGKPLNSDEFLKTDLVALTPEERAQILAVGSLYNDHRHDNRPTIDQPQRPNGRFDYEGKMVFHDHVLFDSIPTLAQWVAVAAETAEKESEMQGLLTLARAAYVEKKIQQATNAVEQKITNHNLYYSDYDIAINFVDAGELEGHPLYAHYLERRAALDLQCEQLREISQLQEQLRKAEQQQAAAVAKAEKALWVATHGSDYLKEAIKRGHDCQRPYIHERAVLEAPGWLIDFAGVCEWKERSCPTKTAIERVCALEKAGTPGAIKIVWLTSAPTTEQSLFEDAEEIEALIIENYLGKYTLYRGV